MGGEDFAPGGEAAEIRDQVVPLFSCLLPYLSRLTGGPAEVLVN